MQLGYFQHTITLMHTCNTLSQTHVESDLFILLKGIWLQSSG